MSQGWFQFWAFGTGSSESPVIETLGTKPLKMKLFVFGFSFWIEESDKTDPGTNWNNDGEEEIPNTWELHEPNLDWKIGLRVKKSEREYPFLKGQYVKMKTGYKRVK